MSSSPTQRSTHEIPIRGDLLSCFTTALATYLAHYGIDYTFAFGLQLYLATHFEQRDGLKGAFIHQHRPLTGASPLYTLHLTRCWTNDQSCVLEKLLQEWQKRGHLIAIGDSFHLPWQANYRKKHIPHWFVIEAIDTTQQKALINDQFEFIDANSTQAAYTDWLPLSLLVDLTKAYDEAPYLYIARDLHGLGKEEHLPAEVYHGYQWFEAGQNVSSKAVSEAYIMQELLDTYQHMVGIQRREDLLQQNWRTGLKAVSHLAELFQEHLTDQQLYDLRDDFWVMSRQRQLFAHTLHQAAQRINRPELETLATWCDKELVPSWSAIPRLMLYNLSLMMRQRMIKDTLVRQAELVYQKEKECLHQMETFLPQPTVLRGGIQSYPAYEITIAANSNNIRDKSNKDESPKKHAEKIEPSAQLQSQVQEASEAPLTPMQEIVKRIWMPILGLNAIGIHDNFFKLKGDSLKAMQILSRLHALFPVEISLITFLDVPTIAQLSAFIERELLQLVKPANTVVKQQSEQIAEE